MPASEPGVDGLSDSVDRSLLEQIFGLQTDKVLRYHELLANEGVEWGLLGPAESGRLWSRHILNSVAVQSLVPESASVLDVGSGAGLPGIPLALARPDLSVTLLDSLLRREKFLRLVVEQLGLDGRVQVVRARAEDLSRRYDVVTARAVAPLDKLVRWCAPLMSQCLLAIKGESAAAELALAQGTLAKMGLSGEVVTVSAASWCAETSVVVVRRF